MLFPAGHPYFEGIPQDELKLYIKALPYDMQFDKVVMDGITGTVRIHKLLIKKEDYDLKLQVAFEKAKNGSKVDILPEIDAREIEWRKIIYPDAFKSYNADLRVDGILTDVKSPIRPLHNNKLSHALSKGSKQGPNVVINLVNKVNMGQQYKLALGKFKDHKRLKEIQFRYNGEYSIWKREKIKAAK